jgi:hypothetical protein
MRACVRNWALRSHVRTGMKPFISSGAAALFLCSLFAAALPLQAQTQTAAEVVRRMIAQDTVRSYTASLHADVVMHSFPFLSPSLDGMYYHKEPSKNKIVFTSGLPFIAQQFSKVYPQVESPTRWFEKYYVSVESTGPSYTVLKLVPRKHGRIDHIDAKVDNKTADLVELRWTYDDGGYATLDQTYGVIQGHRLVTQQTGHLEVPHYSADLKSTFADFHINADIPDSVFADNS